MKGPSPFASGSSYVSGTNSCSASRTPVHDIGFSEAKAAQPTLVSSSPAEKPFWELLEALESFKKQGVTKPKRGDVFIRLSKMHPTFFAKLGLPKWKTYVKLAARGGYVKTGSGVNEKTWISLL
jgi:hypothetical protein